MRDPSIHITKSRFKLILDNLLPSNFSEKQVNDITKDFFRLAAQHNLSQRSLLLKQSDYEKKASRVLSANIEDADLFASILTLIRRRKKHKGITQISKTSKEWLTLKQIVANANNFYTDFPFETKKEAYRDYIEMGMDRMSKYALFKFLGMHENICATYEAVTLSKDDLSPAETKRIHDYYCGKILERTGILSNYSNDPTKYVYFFHAKVAAKKLRIDWKVYIDAQFHGFEWRSTIPDPIQLDGDKARQRAIKYMYEKNITVKSQETIDWAKIKNSNGSDPDTE